MAECPRVTSSDDPVGDCKHQRRVQRLALVASMMAILGDGCGTQTAQQAVERQYKANPQLKRAELARFAGKVTVDGQPPAPGTIILVLLNDPKMPSRQNHPRQFTACAPDGTFEFSTSLKGDGAP